MTVEMDHRLFLAQDFAIINPLQVDRALWQHLPSSVIGTGTFGGGDDMLPRLVHLGKIEELQRLELFDSTTNFTPDGEPPFFSALIRTSASEGTVRRCAGRSLLLRDPARGQHFFRYFDPRVFVHLLRLLSVEQVSHIVAPASTWLWFDPLSSRWNKFSTTTNSTEGNAAPQRLTPEQWDALSRIEIVNRVLRRMAAEHPAASLAVEAVSRIDAHVRVAVNDEGLVEADDLVEYAMNAFKHGVGFHGTKEARAALEQVRGHEASYIAAFSGLGSRAAEAAESN